MSQATLDLIAVSIAAELLRQEVAAFVVVIPGDGKLYGTATLLDTDIDRGIAALGLLEGVTVRNPHPRLGLVTFDYVPQQAQV